jgi:hypothetical protein
MAQGLAPYKRADLVRRSIINGTAYGPLHLMELAKSP